MPIKPPLPKNIKPGKVLPLNLAKVGIPTKYKKSIAQSQKDAKELIPNLKKQLLILQRKADKEDYGKTYLNYVRQIEALHNKIESINNESSKGELFRALKFIDSHCGQFIKEAKKAKKYLYHGFSRNLNNKKIFIGKPRTDREAKDSNQELSDMLDKILISTGFTALRGNSLFCT